MIRFGLVTVLYNGVDVLEGFFKSLAAQTHKNWHLEVIDNSPNEEAINRARELATLYELRDVHFVRNPENYGVAKGNNQGIRNCLELNCDYIILLNNDIEFPEELFSNIAAVIGKDGYDILVPKAYYFDTGKIWYAGGSLNRFSATTTHFGEFKDDSTRYSKDFFTSYAPTCFMAIKSTVFAKVGMMDERYFVYYDDTDFSLRCRRAGIKLRYLGTLSLHHKVSSSTGGRASNFTVYYYNRNRLFFLRKNLNRFVFPFALLWYLATRAYKYCIYPADNRAALVKAVRDGFAVR